MPYNTTPISPPKQWSGSVSLPLARVKKIINADDEINTCSNNAAFVIAVATEMFVQYLVEQAQVVVKSERRPRRNIQYRDMASAISRVDNLEFLTDVVPKTMTYKAYKQKKAREEAQGDEKSANEPDQLQQAQAMDVSIDSHETSMHPAPAAWTPTANGSVHPGGPAGAGPSNTLPVHTSHAYDAVRGLNGDPSDHGPGTRMEE